MKRHGHQDLERLEELLAFQVESLSKNLSCFIYVNEHLVHLLVWTWWFFLTRYTFTFVFFFLIMNSNDQVDPDGRVESQGNSCPSLLEVKQLRSGMVFSTKRQHLLQLIILLLSLPVIYLYAFLDPLSVFFSGFEICTTHLLCVWGWCWLVKQYFEILIAELWHDGWLRTS